MGLEGFATVADLAHFRVTKSDTATEENSFPFGEGRDGDWTSGMVTGVFRHVANSVYHLRYDNGDSLGVTGTHPLYSLDRQQFIPVTELRIGEKLLSKSGAVTLTKKIYDPTAQEVYNLEVGQWHNFLVGRSGVVVHNTGCSHPEVQKKNFDLLENLITNNPGKSNKEILELAKDKLIVPDFPFGYNQNQFDGAQNFIKNFLKGKGIQDAEGFATGSRVVGVTTNPIKPDFGKVKVFNATDDLDITLVTPSKTFTKSEQVVFEKELQEAYQYVHGHPLGIRLIPSNQLQQLNYIPIYGKIPLNIK